MAGRKKKESVMPSADWMTTFSDLVTLLLTFFVLLLTMSSMDAKKLKDSFGFFSGTVGNLGPASGSAIRRPSVEHPPSVLPNSLDALYGAKPLPLENNLDKTLDELLEEQNQRALESEFLEMERTDLGVDLRMAGVAAFSDDERRLTTEARRLLLDVADLSVAAGLNLEIDVNVAPAPGRVESAWQHATELGDAAANLLQKRGLVPAESIYLKTYGRPSKRSIAGHKSGLSLKLVAPQSKEPPNGR